MRGEQVEAGAMNCSEVSMEYQKLLLQLEAGFVSIALYAISINPDLDLSKHS